MPFICIHPTCLGYCLFDAGGVLERRRRCENTGVARKRLTTVSSRQRQVRRTRMRFPRRGIQYGVDRPANDAFGHGGAFKGNKVRAAGDDPSDPTPGALHCADTPWTSLDGACVACPKGYRRRLTGPDTQ